MRLRQIEIFYHVYRAGSISGAARNLFVSQPSVSKVLRHLEDQLGFDLFLRDKGRLVATEAAHELRNLFGHDLRPGFGAEIIAGPAREVVERVALPT